MKDTNLKLDYALSNICQFNQHFEETVYMNNLEK